MMWNLGVMDYNWWAIIFAVVVNIVLWGGLLVLALTAIYGIWRPRGYEADALEILRRRFASGEITAEEYERDCRILLHR